MTIRTVCKELVRTPMKTVLFLVLLALSTALLVLGVNLYVSCQAAREQVSLNYKTVGTIEQKADSIQDIDEETAESIIRYFPWEDPYAKYTVTLPEGLFDGLPTKYPVENRPTLITTADIYSQFKPDEAARVETPKRIYPVDVLTFTPLEDIDSADENFMSRFESLRRYGLADFSLSAQITAINGEALDRPQQYTLYWPAGETELVTLKAGTEYISAAIPGYSDGDGSIYSLTRASGTTAISKGGMEYEIAEHVAYENTPEFAQTQVAQWLDELSLSSQNLHDMEYNTVITVPTQSLDLLDPFYQDKVTMRQGREITQEEFDTGAKVCMISEDFLYGGPDAANPDFLNFVNVGDKLRLNWHGAVYGEGPAQVSTRLDSISITQGTCTYEIAGTEEYEVVGLFASTMTGMDYENGGLTNLGNYQIIVPSASFDFESIPIVSGGPIKQGACSFELENGTGGAFLDALEKLEYSDLIQVSLSDQGYSAIAKGLDAISLLAMILLLAGGASALCLLLFFVYLQIARREREAAIQISLGAGRRRSAAFLLLSVLLVAVVGIAAGTVLGHQVTDQVSTQVYTQAKESGFSREYSDQFEASQDKEFVYDGRAQWPRSLGAGLSALGAGLVLSIAFTANSLRKEPLEQLTRKD